MCCFELTLKILPVHADKNLKNEQGVIFYEILDPL